MKIAVASDDNVNLALHFGRTKGFIVYEIENNEIKKREYVMNTFTGHSNGLHHHEHAGHHHSHRGILEALKECSVVISHGMGRRMLVDFERVGKEVFITSANSADDAIKMYLTGNLQHNPDRSCSDAKSGE